MKKLRGLIVVGIGTVFTLLVGFVVQGWCSGHLKAATSSVYHPKAEVPTVVFSFKRTVWH